MCTDTSHYPVSVAYDASRQRGVTLIELIVFIVIVSVAVAGVLSVLNKAVSNSADPQIQKQALAIAEALLEEVELQPFTFCDPDDDNAATAGGAGGCANNAAAIAPEFRAVDPRFDNVIDYNNFVMAGVSDPAGTVLPGAGALGGYTATVAVANDAGLGTAAAPIAAAEVLRITVTVVHRATGVTIALGGYRSRYAPRI